MVHISFVPTTNPDFSVLPSYGFKAFAALDDDVFAMGLPFMNEVRMFRRGSSGWKADGVIKYDGKQCTLENFYTECSYFGSRISISNSRLALGIPKDNTTQGTDLSWGAVQIFNYNGMNWVLAEKLVNPVANEGYGFGSQVLLKGTTLFVTGQPNSKLRESRRVYVYRIENGGWKLVQRLASADSEARIIFGSNFGSDLLFDQNILVVADAQRVTGGPWRLYFYELINDLFVYKAFLAASYASFGQDLALSMSGNKLLVGNRYDSSLSNDPFMRHGRADFFQYKK